VKEEILQKIDEIPPLSQSATQLLNLMGDPDHDVMQVTKIVECDPALTARVLRVVNSARFSLVNPALSIARAVSYLGDKIVLGIALESCARDVFSRPLEGYECERGALWAHSLRAAIASRLVSRDARGKISPDLAFTGGILHDIGKAVVSGFLKDSGPGILEEIDAGDTGDYPAAERDRLGSDHSVAGYRLAKSWGLPYPLPEIIRHHHRPSGATEAIRPLVYAVHLGDIMAMLGGTGTGCDDLQYRMDGGFSDHFRISPDGLERIMLRVEEEFRQTMFSIFGSGEVK